MIIDITTLVIITILIIIFCYYYDRYSRYYMKPTVRLGFKRLAPMTIRFGRFGRFGQFGRFGSEYNLAGKALVCKTGAVVFHMILYGPNSDFSFFFHSRKLLGAKRAQEGAKRA